MPRSRRRTPGANATRLGTPGAPATRLAPKPLRLEYHDPATLAPHPGNWKRHPAKQLRALTGLLREVGWAGALLFNERTGRLLDGHARRRVAAGRKVPVLVGEWSAADERKILATLDPVAALAQPDPAAVTRLLKRLRANDRRVAALLDSLRHRGLTPPGSTDTVVLPPARFEVIVECKNGPAQRRLFRRLTKAGHRCRLATF
jgi:hypothetical protein